MRDGNINILLDEWNTQQKDITILEKLTWCVDIYVGIQAPYNQRYKGLSLRQLG